MKSKKFKKKQKINSLDKFFFYLVSFLIFLIIVVSTLNIWKIFGKDKFGNSNNIIASPSATAPKNILVKFLEFPTATLTLTPTPMLSPTLTPSSTQAPAEYAGFCLNVPVLFYHHVQPNSIAEEKGQTSFTVDNNFFDQQMAYISSNYTTISAEELINALRTNTQLPARSIVITLDDGYRDIYQYAYPIFQKYQIKASIMIPTGLMEGNDYLTWGQIEEMSRSNLISFANHTWSHYSLGATSDRAKIKQEIETAQVQLEQHLGKKVNILTYPYGSFNNTVVQILKEDGFIGAFSTIGGTYQCDSFIMSLHRTRIGNAPLSSYGL